MNNAPSGIVFIDSAPISVTIQESHSIVVSSNTASNSVVISSENTVVSTSVSSEVVTHGQQGPPGRDGVSEDDMVYTKRIDFISENELYRGEAQVGSSEAALAWRIRKITIAPDSDIAETWALGTANFDKSWSFRQQYSYT